MRYVLAFLALVCGFGVSMRNKTGFDYPNYGFAWSGGRKFDHLAVDIKAQVIPCRVNQTIEVFDLATGKEFTAISGFGTPHAEIYVPGSNELCRLGDDGTCKFLRGETFELIKSLKISVGADRSVYDPARNT